MSNETGSAAQPLDDWFLALLACPGCEQRHPLILSADASSLLCSCGKYRFAISDGIPNLLVDNAEIIDANANPASVQKTGGKAE